MMGRFANCTIGCLVLVAPNLNQPATARHSLPINAKPGECFAKVLVPASYRITSERIMTQTGGTKYAKSPAVYRTSEKKVLVAEESFKFIVTPAIYKVITEKVVVQLEQKIKTVIPATLRTISKQVLISPAQSQWKV